MLELGGFNQKPLQYCAFSYSVN